MLFIPGFLISLLTFPGVIVHEFAHRLFCDLAKVPVYKVCYFRIENPAGYVIHGPANGLKKSLLISAGPLIVNTILCALLTFPAVFPIIVLNAEKYNIVFTILMWVGFSIGMHAFPSNADIKIFVREVKNEKHRGILFVFAKIFSGIIKLVNVLRIVWFDAIYALGITLLLPWLIGIL
jgi:hypothetical protein